MPESRFFDSPDVNLSFLNPGKRNKREKTVTQARIHTGFHRFTENVRFYKIDIFLIKKKLSKLQGFIRGDWNWPISCLNDFGSREIKGDFRELKSKKFPGQHARGYPECQRVFFLLLFAAKTRHDRGGQYTS